MSSNQSYEEYVEDEKPFQIVFRKGKKSYIRAKPYTAYKPTEAQIRARIAFSEAAKQAKGMKVSLLPPAALAVKANMEKKDFGGKAKEPKWLKLLMYMVYKQEERKDLTKEQIREQI
jgi:hypothetical protein